jgi:Tol biopolymer transport system component
MIAVRAWSTVAALAAGCSFPGASPAGDAPVDALDAIPADAFGTPRWEQPTVVALPFAEQSDDDPSLTEDGLELYFNSARGTANPDIWVATRATATSAWNIPLRVVQLSSVANETTPEVSPDGLTIYFATDRSGGNVGMDIWKSTRPNRSSLWGAPVFVAELSSPAGETAGGTADDLHIAISYIPPGEAPQVAVSERATVGDPWSPIVLLDGLNTPSHEGSVLLSPDRHWIYFDSNRTGNLDLYGAYRADVTQPFGPPMPLPGVNSAVEDADPWISPDGRHCMFVSNRGGIYQIWEARR